MGLWSVASRSSAQTRNWDGKLGKLLKGSEIIDLVSELGTGKTCFVRGMAEGLDVGPDAWIRNPTFTLINEYHSRLPVYHIDLYKVGSREELEELNLREYLYSDGVSVVEWFEHLPADEVNEYLEVKLAYANGNKQQLMFTPRGKRYEQSVEGLTA